MMKPTCTEVSSLWYQSNRDNLWIRGLILVPLVAEGQSTETAVEHDGRGRGGKLVGFVEWKWGHPKRPSGVETLGRPA